MPRSVNPSPYPSCITRFFPDWEDAICAVGQIFAALVFFAAGIVVAISFDAVS